jgi:hypothetical protein
MDFHWHEHVPKDAARLSQRIGHDVDEVLAQQRQRMGKDDVEMPA